MRAALVTQLVAQLTDQLTDQLAVVSSARSSWIAHCSSGMVISPSGAQPS